MTRIKRFKRVLSYLEIVLTLASIALILTGKPRSLGVSLLTVVVIALFVGLFLHRPVTPG